MGQKLQALAPQEDRPDDLSLTQKPHKGGRKELASQSCPQISTLPTCHMYPQHILYTRTHTYRQ